MNTPVSFLSPVQTDITSVEQRMLAQADGNHPDLQAALQHLLSSGGKRLRPALTLLTGRMFSGPHEGMITLAAAIELLHTATLVHDDLIDGSLLRRGIPTLNASWSPAATVLTGDFLFARAAKLSADTHSVDVMSIFASTLGVIVNGEITQLFNSRCKVDKPEYLRRIYAKTASLFETCTRSAAILSNASSQQINAVGEFGKNLGLAFQIMDDILDFTADSETLGKPVGSDLRQGLVTLPTILYAEKNQEHPLVKHLLQGECLTPDEVDEMIQLIRESSSIQESHAEAHALIADSLKHLHLCPPCPERDYLEEMAFYSVGRKL